MAQCHHILPCELAIGSNFAAVVSTESRIACHRVYTVGNRAPDYIVGLAHLEIRHKRRLIGVESVAIVEVENLVFVVSYGVIQGQPYLIHTQDFGGNRGLNSGIAQRTYVALHYGKTVGGRNRHIQKSILSHSVVIAHSER